MGRPSTERLREQLGRRVRSDVGETDRGWHNVWEIDAITDEHGVARAALPTDDLDSVRSSLWRLVAVFDGNAVAKGSLSPSSDVRFLNRPAAQQLGPP